MGVQYEGNSSEEEVDVLRECWIKRRAEHGMQAMSELFQDDAHRNAATQTLESCQTLCHAHTRYRHACPTSPPPHRPSVDNPAYTLAFSTFDQVSRICSLENNAIPKKKIAQPTPAARATTIENCPKTADGARVPTETEQLSNPAQTTRTSNETWMFHAKTTSR